MNFEKEMEKRYANFKDITKLDVDFLTNDRHSLEVAKIALKQIKEKLEPFSELLSRNVWEHNNKDAYKDLEQIVETIKENVSIDGWKIHFIVNEVIFIYENYENKDLYDNKTYYIPVVKVLFNSGEQKYQPHKLVYTFNEVYPVGYNQNNGNKIDSVYEVYSASKILKSKNPTFFEKTKAMYYLAKWSILMKLNKKYLKELEENKNVFERKESR